MRLHDARTTGPRAPGLDNFFFMLFSRHENKAMQSGARFVDLLSSLVADCHGSGDCHLDHCCRGVLVPDRARVPESRLPGRRSVPSGRGRPTVSMGGTASPEQPGMDNRLDRRQPQMPLRVRPGAVCEEILRAGFCGWRTMLVGSILRPGRWRANKRGGRGFGRHSKGAHHPGVTAFRTAGRKGGSRRGKLPADW